MSQYSNYGNSTPVFKDPIKPEWITQGIDNDAIEWARTFGEYLSPEGKNNSNHKPMTTSQLRRFFGEVKRIDADFETNKQSVSMLRPMLAYAAGKDSGTKLSDFQKIIDPAIEQVDKAEDSQKRTYFKNFVNLFEAIVAYHKFYGGK